ncbi:MAG: ComEA family DNA-binding protein [Acidimicrobiia bacterium]|nr:ComEA family DNA-binding protein [Acidimicrobiia bacterium]
MRRGAARWDSTWGCTISRPITPALGGISAVIAIVVLGGLWFGGGPAATAAPERGGMFGSMASTAGTEITVHVSGAVVRPGLVVVPAGARVADVVSAAGGALRNADLARLNLAATVRDAEHIHVPGAVADRPANGSEADPGVDLNRADASELETLPGVGPVLAQRIVAHREANGPFATIEDLLDVPGIGEAKLSQLREAVKPP